MTEDEREALALRLEQTPFQDFLHMRAAAHNRGP